MSRFFGVYPRRVNKSGEICLPPQFRAELGDEKSVVLVGCGGYFELWPRNQWEQEKKKTSKILEEVKK